MEEQKMALDNLIYKIRIGSQMYGTNTPDSDEDIGGIFIPDKDYVLGIKRCDQVILNQKRSKSVRNKKGDIDYTVYSLPKFIHLAIGNNPNIIEFFFAHKTCILKYNRFAEKLLGSYKLFISKNSYHTFKGYAYSQRKRLEVKKANMTGRTELTEKFGYDVKFASHLIRMLLEGQQILSEGRLTLPLPQNNLVRDIKIGRYSLDWILEKATELEKFVDLAYTNTKLQYTADLKAINRLQIELLTDYWSEGTLSA